MLFIGLVRGLEDRKVWQDCQVRQLNMKKEEASILMRNKKRKN